MSQKGREKEGVLAHMKRGGPSKVESGCETRDNEGNPSWGGQYREEKKRNEAGRG